MTQPLHPTDALSLVAGKLNAAGYRWMLVGSMAGLLYGHVRSTVDMDIVLDCKGLDPQRLSDTFAPEYYLDEQMIQTSAPLGIMFNAISMGAGPKVDLIPLVDQPFERGAFERRQAIAWHGTPVMTTTSEDLVLSKLRWAAASQSARQLGDVRAIMALGLFDEHASYFQHWVRTFGVERLLDACRTSRYEA